MRIKMKRLFVVVLTMAMVITGLLGNGTVGKAATEDIIYIAENVNLVVTPGLSTHISIPIKIKEAYMFIDDISVSSTNGKFTFTKPTLSEGSNKTDAMFSNGTYKLEFDAITDESTEIGSYQIKIDIEYHKGDLGSTTFSLYSKLIVQEEKTPAQLTVSNVKLDSTNIGNTASLTFSVKNEGQIIAKSAYLTMDFGTVMEGNYSAKNIKVGDLASGSSKDISLPVTILSTATIGKNALTAKFSYKTSNGDKLTSEYKMYVNLTSNSYLTITDMKYGDSLKPGEDFTLEVSLENSGSGPANNIVADISSSSISQDGIIKDYYSDGIIVSDISKGKTGKAEIPLTVSKYATGGMKSVVVDITYTDKSGTKYTLSETTYIDVNAATTAGNPNLVISNVVQSPAQPQAGDKVTLTFTLENKSKVDATEIKLYPDGLTGTTFIPVESEPYQYIEKLAGGAKKTITIPLIVSTGITEGVNNLTVKYTYTGGEGSVNIPVHDVQNDAGSSSIPKLIISKYSTDSEELKAGSTFIFNYSIYNTNSSVAAKNITITITQADNIFTVTQGSNSFFINKIAPGETVENSIEMKVKSDATTKAYPISIAIEYEYDGIKANPETGEVGIKKTETLNLNAMENARPVADNIMVTSWDGQVMAGTNATLTFYFYNMGKSVLNNVIATVEGDGFTKADGSMFFIGNVEAGASTPVEFEVIPNMEGSVPGILKLSYEDSNGDTVEFTKEFTAEVMPAAVFDPGTVDGGGEVFNPELSIAKKPILPIWAFILIWIAMFVVLVTVSRNVIISIYKTKLRKKEQEQY